LTYSIRVFINLHIYNTIQIHMLIRSLSIILILMYLLLPVICFVHPCVPDADAVADVFASEPSGNWPDKHDADECDTTCCCAAYVPVPMHNCGFCALVARNRIQDPRLSLPEVTMPIFVPPQNHV
jgi:hypothetical protein